MTIVAKFVNIHLRTIGVHRLSCLGIQRQNAFCFYVVTSIIHMRLKKKKKETFYDPWKE